jgi:dienelactone hydrolase
MKYSYSAAEPCHRFNSRREDNSLYFASIPYPTRCEHVSIPTLRAEDDYLRGAIVCYPWNSLFSPLPLHMYGHGDGEFYMYGDGGFEGESSSSPRYLREVAARGFFVVAHLSCVMSCGRGKGSAQKDDSPEGDRKILPGQSDFIEMLEAVSHLESDPKFGPMIDTKGAYSASGFSTGGRAVLQIAALRDSPRYLESAPHILNLVTEKHRAIANKVISVTAMHPDPMISMTINPDVFHFRVSKMPVLVLTGTEDTTEPQDSAWVTFDKMLSTPRKVFANFEGHTHEVYPGYANLAARFSHAFASLSSGHEEVAWDEWSTCVLGGLAEGKADGKIDSQIFRDGNGSPSTLTLASGLATNSGGKSRGKDMLPLMSNGESRLGYYVGPS